MVSKNVIVTEHQIKQVVIEDKSNKDRALNTIKTLKDASEASIRKIYATQEDYSRRARELDTKSTTSLGVTLNNNLGKHRLHSSVLASLYRKRADSEIIELQRVGIELDKLRAQQAFSTSATGGKPTTSTANPGGSSTQGSINLGGSSKTTAALEAEAKAIKALGANLNAYTVASTKASKPTTTFLNKLHSMRGTTPKVSTSLKSLNTNLGQYTSTASQAGQATTSFLTRLNTLRGTNPQVASSLTQVNTQLATMGTTAAKTSTSTKQLTKDTHGLFSTMKRAMVTVPAFYGVAKAIMVMHDAVGAAITRTIEFDLASRTLAAVLSGQSIMATRAATKEFTNLSTVLGGAIADYETASLLLARSGIGDDVLNDLTKAVGITAQLSLITGESLELAASAIITFKQAYSKGADGLEAYGGALQDIGDKIAFMANASKLSLQDIGTFSNYAVAAGKAAGLTQDSLNGMAIAFSNAGNKASTIGTQIRRFTATLTSSREGVIKLYDSIGVNRTKLNADLQKSKSGLKEDIKSSNDAFKEFVLMVAALDQVGYNQATAGMAILDKQFFDNLRNNSAEILDNVETSFNGVSGALDKTGIMADALGKRWEAMGNKVIIGSQDMATSVSNMGTYLAEGLAESFVLLQNIASLDLGEAAASFDALGAIDGMEAARGRLVELQEEGRTATKEELTDINKEANSLLSLISLRKQEVALNKEKAAAERLNWWNLEAAGEFTTKQILRLEIVKAKQAQINAKGDIAKSLATDKLSSLIQAQKYLREELNEKKRVNGVEQVALLRAEAMVGYSKLDVVTQKAVRDALVEQLNIQNKINLAQGTTPDDMSNTKAFIGLTNEAEAHELIGQRIETNVKALEKSYGLIKKNSDATRLSAENDANNLIILQEEGKIKEANALIDVIAAKGDVLANSLLVEKIIDLQKAGKYTEANLLLNRTELQLSKNKSQEASNLAGILTNIKKYTTIILNYNSLDEKIIKQKVAYQVKLDGYIVNMAKAQSNILIAQNKSLVLSGKVTKEQLALNTATAKHEAAIKANDTAQASYNKLVNKGVDFTKDLETEQKSIDVIVKAYTRTQETSLELTKSANAETQALTTNANAMANAILKASNNSLTLASNLRNAVAAFKGMQLESEVISGGISAYNASVIKGQTDIKNAKLAVKDIDANTLVLKEQLAKVNAGEVVTGQTRLSLEESLQKNDAKRLAATTAVGVSQNKLAQGARDEYKASIEHTRAMQEGYNRIDAAQSKVLSKKERGVAESKAQLIVLKDNYEASKRISDLPNASRGEEETTVTNKAAYEEGVKRLKEEQLDLAVKLSKGDTKAAKIYDREARNKLKMLKEEEKQRIGLAKLANVSGVNRLKIELVELKKQQVELAKIEKIASKSRATEETKLMHKEAQTDVINNNVKIAEKELEIARDYSSVFEDLFSGDIEGAFEGIMGKIGENMKLDSMGDSWSNLLSTMLNGFKGFSTALDMTIMSSVWGFLLKIGLDRFQEFFGGSVLTEAEIKEAEGITDVLSDSVTNSLAAIESNGVIGLEYSSEMVRSLRALVQLSDRASAGIGDTLSGSEYIGGGDSNFWGGKSYELMSTGVKLESASIKELEDGLLDGYEYMIEKVTKTSWFGLSSSESTKETVLGDVDGDVMSAITGAYLAGADAIESASMALGMSEEEFERLTDAWETSVSQLNFEGKSSDEISEMINGAISNDLDLWADTLIGLTGYLEEYKLAGEASAETLIRLANDYEVINQSLAKMGVDLDAVGEGGLRMAEGLAKAAGGLDAFIEKLDFFYDNFYTDDEQIAMKTAVLQAEFARLGLTLPTTTAGMRELIEVKLAEIKVLAAEISIAKAKYEADWALAQATTTLTQIQLENAQATYYAGMAIIETNQMLLDALNVDLDSIMDTLPTWTDVYGTAQEASDAAEAAATALEIVYASLVDIASLKATWMDDTVEGTKLVLDATVAETGITGVGIDNFLEEFTKASAGGMEQEDFDNWSALSAALKSYEAALDELVQVEKDWLNSQIDFYAGMLDKIQDAYMGSLSYLTTPEKADYAEQIAQVYLDSGDNESYYDALYSQLENEMKTTTTKEEYIPIFDKYIDELQKAEPEKDTDDVVDELEALNIKIDNLVDAIEKASYQK